MEKTIRWNIDPEELARIQLAGMGLTKKGIRNGLLALGAFGAVVTALTIWFLYTSGFNWSRVAPLPVLLVIIPVFLLVRYWDIPRRIRKTAKDQKALLGEHVLTFTGEHLIFKGPYGVSTLPWSVFTRWKEAGDYLFLYQSESLANFIPKARLDAETMEFIRGRIPNAPAPSPFDSFSRTGIVIAVLLSLMIAAWVWAYSAKGR
jgi:hypothetical protein